MNKRLWAGVLVLLIFSGCTQAPSGTSDMSSGSADKSVSSSLWAESEESMTENSASIAEVGVNGMTEKEILELFMRKVNEANDFYFWLDYDCYTDINEDLEKIYDIDDTNPEGFYWLPLVRFETRKALYDYMGTVFPARGVPVDLDWMFGEEMVGPDENMNPVYLSIFKEIGGRLYVRDRDYPRPWGDERRKHFNYDFETAAVAVAEETEGKITVDVRKNPEIVVGGDRLTLLLENSNWVIVSLPTHLGLEPASSPEPEKDDAQ